MGRTIEIEGIFIYVQTAPCANHCCYCQLDVKKVSNIAFARFRSVVERFREWKEERGLADFKVQYLLQRSFNRDINTQKGLIQLEEPDEVRAITLPVLLGGLYWRPDDEMRGWLKQWQEIGFSSVGATFAGHGRFHDRWNGRKGDFDFQMRALRTAADLGMDLYQRLFLAKSTIPLLDELIEKLDALPGRLADRCIFPLFYLGHARRMEDERVTRETLDGLQEHIRGLYRSDWKKWRSEREWIDFVRTEDKTPDVVPLPLQLNDSNIDSIESMSCDEIIAELERKTREAYAAIPSRAELCGRYGDPFYTRIYMFKEEVERKWLDLHLAKNPTVLDRESMFYLRP